MATQVSRDISEHHITLRGLDISGAVLGFVALPVSGDLVRATAVMTALSDEDCAITFEIAGVEVDQGGSAATLTMLDADIVGDVQVLELSKNSTTFLSAAEDGDAIAAGATMEIIGDAVPTGGTIDLTLTFRP
jgi:hypothetical protein